MLVETVRKGFVDFLAASLSVPVFSRVPDESRPPFVIVSGITFDGPGIKTGSMWPVVVSILAVTAARSPQPCDELVSAIVALADGVSIPMMPLNSTPSRLLSAVIAERGEQDGKLWVGEVLFRQTVG